MLKNEIKLNFPQSKQSMILNIRFSHPDQLCMPERKEKWFHCIMLDGENGRNKNKAIIAS